MTTQFRPMLAVPMEQVEDIRFPVLVSPKIDGIRCVIRDGVPYTRKLKHIPNKHIFAMLSSLPDLDGEIVVGNPTGEHGFDTTQSAVMSFEGEPDFTYYVFDDPSAEGGFLSRLVHAHTKVRELTRVDVQALHHSTAATPAQLQELEENYVAAGYEGLMIRSIDGPYKHGRSTLKEGHLLKMIRRHTAEAVVIGFVERMHNANEAEVSELGLTKRSKKKANLVPAGTLGALRCVWLDAAKYGEAEFEIGTGFDDAKRADIWANQNRWRSAIINFEFREITKDGAPRFPSFKGQRFVGDIGDVDEELGKAPVLYLPQAHRCPA